MFRVFSIEQGLDLVRREWCVLSKDTGKYVLDRILSGEARETVVATIHEHLETLATSMRAGEVTVPQYVITKGLNKAPHEYPDAKSQPHVQARVSYFHVCGLSFVFYKYWISYVAFCTCTLYFAWSSAGLGVGSW